MFGLFGFQESKQEARGGSPEGKKKEKIMKKSCKIFSAIALSAILAMGTAMPAFAKETSEVNAGDATNATNYNRGEGAQTNVNIATYSSNYSVTIPLYAPFLLDTAGGQGMSPSNYYIQNQGNSDVFVTQIDWEMNTGYQNDWTFGTAWASSAAIAVNPKSGTTDNPTYGSFVIKLSPNAFDGRNIDTVVEEAAAGKDTTKGSTSTLADNKKPQWHLKHADLTETDQTSNAYLGKNMIDLDVRGSVLAKSLTATQTEVAAIKYTVATSVNFN